MLLLLVNELIQITLCTSCILFCFQFWKHHVFAYSQPVCLTPDSVIVPESWRENTGVDGVALPSRGEMEAFFPVIFSSLSWRGPYRKKQLMEIGVKSRTSQKQGAWLLLPPCDSLWRGHLWPSRRGQIDLDKIIVFCLHKYLYLFPSCMAFYRISASWGWKIYQERAVNCFYILLFLPLCTAGNQTQGILCAQQSPFPWATPKLLVFEF